MKVTDTQLKNIPVFGIAGNFAEHLSQAGEDADFINIATEEENAPKGVFPIYLPNFPGFLSTYPLSSTTIEADFSHPINCQLEPEVCILFEVNYHKGQVAQLTPEGFSAFNDCSIRRPNAKKISQKKNWGANCAGLSNDWISLNNLKPGCKLDDYNIISFLKRGDQVEQYGMDSPVIGYQFFHEKLINWLINTLNQQQNIGPLEPLSEYIEQLNQPKQIIITLGATRYTTFGETGFLQPDDELSVYIYHNQQTHAEAVLTHFESGSAVFKNGCLLRQTVQQTSLDTTLDKSIEAQAKWFSLAPKKEPPPFYCSPY